MRASIDSFKSKYFDSHMHSGIWLSSLFDDKYPSSQNPIELSKCLNENGIDYGIVFPFPSYYCGNGILDNGCKNEIIRQAFEEVPYLLANQRLLLEIKQLAIKNLLPMLMFSTNYEINSQLNFLNNCIKKEYVYGLKYYPDADGKEMKNFENDGYMFIDFLIKNNLPIVIHTSESATLKQTNYSNPMDIVNIAKKFPELRIVIAHMAHFNKEVISVIKKEQISNIFLDTSPFLHLCNIRSINKNKLFLDLEYTDPVAVMKYMINILPNNIIWGSDMPFNFTCNLLNENHNKDYFRFSYDKNIEILNKMVKVKKRIMSINTLNMLYGGEMDV